MREDENHILIIDKIKPEKSVHGSFTNYSTLRLGLPISSELNFWHACLKKGTSNFMYHIIH